MSSGAPPDMSAEAPTDNTAAVADAASQTVDASTLNQETIVNVFGKDFLLENKEDPESSRMIFSTYPTMLNAIDEIIQIDHQTRSMKCQKS